jgi:hypothetical protein
MVTRVQILRARRRGSLMLELLVAMVLLSIALLPLAYATFSEYKLARAYYQRAVALELVDGEIEVLAAGEWRSFPVGTQDYPIRASAATNLPPGRLVLTLQPPKVRLDWEPAAKGRSGPVSREVFVQ